jgi:hypothetical protein
MKEALKMALEALNDLAAWHDGEVGGHMDEPYAAEVARRTITAIKESLAQPEQEPAVLKWQQAPIRTAWGDDMVVASIAIDNDHTLSLYCERDQTAKVEAMLEKTMQWPLHGKSADCLREMYELLQRCENEMRYAGWDKREADNYARNDVYKEVKEYLEKNNG